MATENTGPLWLAKARELVGLKEIVGSRHEAKVLQFFAEAGHPSVKNDETPWCAAFANAMVRSAGYAGTGSLMARSFLNWGTKLAKPTPGCIVVFPRGTPPSGHVGFVDRVNADGSLMVLGGNQGNAVSIVRFGSGDVLGYRWPLIKSAPAAGAKPKTPAKETAKAGGAAIGGAVVVGGAKAASDAGWTYTEIGLAIAVIGGLIATAYFAWRWWQKSNEPADEPTYEQPPQALDPPHDAHTASPGFASADPADQLAADIAAQAKASVLVHQAASEAATGQGAKKAATGQRRAKAKPVAKAKRPAVKKRKSGIMAQTPQAV